MARRAISSRGRRFGCAATRDVAAAAIVLVGAALAGCPAPDREAGFRRVAMEQGVAFLGSLPTALDPSIRALPSPSAHERNFFPRVLASDARLVFDWVTRDGALKERDRVAQTAFAWRRPGAEMPRFVWTDRRSLTPDDRRRLGDALAFPEDVAFSDRHAVAGPDRRALRVLFDAEARASLARADGLRVEGAGEWVIAYRPGELVDPFALPARAAEIERGLAAWLGAVQDR